MSNDRTQQTARAAASRGGTAPRAKRSRDDEKALMERLQDGCRECAGELIQSCLGFVVQTAHEFRGFGVPFEDLVNEGNVGLLEAARRFDVDRGTKFITYARWWIRKAILRALDEQSRVVRVPSYQLKRSREIRAAESALARQLGRAPSAAEVAARLHRRPSGIERGGALRYREVSLDERPPGESRATLGERLREERRADPEKLLIDRQSLCLVLEAWELLTIQERRVLTRRFGLTGEPVLSLKAVGETMNLSHERVRQIEAKAIARIRRTFDSAARGRPGVRAPKGRKR